MSFFRKFLIVAFSTSTLFCYSQFELWTGAGLDLGVPAFGKYANSKSIIKPHFSKLHNENIYIQARFKKLIGIEVFASQNSQYYVYNDIKFYHETGDKYEATIKVANHYTSVGANLIYRQPLPGSYVGIYGSIGYKNNFAGNKSVTDEQTFSLNSQKFSYTSNSLGTGGGILAEAGIQIVTDDEKNMFTVGFQYFGGLKTLYKGDFLASKTDGSYTDKVTSNLSSFALAFKYHYRLYYYDKSEKIEEPTNEEVVKHQEYVHPSQRKVEVKDSIVVKTKKIVIDLYEPYQEDHDRVSILLNGRVVLDNYTVQKKHYQFEVELYPGVNTLVFQAENLGDIPPNTANIFVIENGKKKLFDMKANLNTSQSLIINFKP